MKQKTMEQKMRLSAVVVTAALGCSTLGAEEAKSQNWLGTQRDALEESGVSFGGEFIYEYSHVLDGGIRRDGSGRRMFTLMWSLILRNWLG